MDLAAEDTYGLHRVKLEAGNMILYPSSSLHRVEPVTRDERMAAVFWAQSPVRNDTRLTLLFDMGQGIQRAAEMPSHADVSIISLTGAYHNLLTMLGGGSGAS